MEVTEHFDGHILGKGRVLLDALRSDLSGVDRAVVVVDRLRQVQPEVPDSAQSVSNPRSSCVKWDKKKAYGGSAKGILRKLVTEPLVVP